MKIEADKITEYQKLIIAKGLYDYQYIMNNWEDVNNDDFYKVYYDFYLSARGGIMRIDGNKIPYYSKLREISPNEDFIEVLNQLKDEMKCNCYEFSLVSKLLHTRNPNKPIYDSKVKAYLSTNEGVEFWWYRNKGMCGKSAPTGTTEIDKIKHDWEKLCEWYLVFLKSDRCKKLIEWFDINFPEFKDISNVKKIDFIIFATN